MIKSCDIFDLYNLLYIKYECGIIIEFVGVPEKQMFLYGETRLLHLQFKYINNFVI